VFHKAMRGAAVDDVQEASEALPPAASVVAPWEVPGSLRRLGLASWFFVGVVAAVGIVVAGLVVTAGIVVPLLFAFYFGAVIFPVVDWLERRRVPRAAGALLIVVLAILGMVAAAWIVIVGILDQGPALARTSMQPPRRSSRG
jgi:predicted PurR-regulated permease PerM